jgi:hypothetical protein
MIHSFSFAKSNISLEVIEAQKEVMSKFPNVRHTVYIDDSISHAQFCDMALKEWQETEHEGDLMFLDIDCIPVSKNAFDFFEYYEFAGNVQRSNHIENGKHLFVAPSCMFISEYCKLWQFPCFAPTDRGDVGEELSYSIKPKLSDFLLPTRHLRKPLDSSQSWKLNNCLNDFGRFTFFGNPLTGEELFMHAFQMRLDQDKFLFLQICREFLTR